MMREVSHVCIEDFRRNFKLNSSHTLAYNPNARRAYEKSQHAEDFRRIKNSVTH